MGKGRPRGAVARTVGLHGGTLPVAGGLAPSSRVLSQPPVPPRPRFDWQGRHEPRTCHTPGALTRADSMSGRQGGKLKPLKAPKKASKELDEDVRTKR